jgi:hypothetical protein
VESGSGKGRAHQPETAVLAQQHAVFGRGRRLGPRQSDGGRQLSHRRRLRERAKDQDVPGNVTDRPARPVQDDQLLRRRDHLQPDHVRDLTFSKKKKKKVEEALNVIFNVLMLVPKCE